MQQRFIALYCLALIIPLLTQSQLQPIGNWREHLPYQQVTRVFHTTNRIWAATPYSIFSVDVTNNSIERFSRITGLSETGIRAIGYDETGGGIIIGYTNSNVDVLYQNELVTISDIKNTTITGDKTIYHIYTRNQLAYLSTGIGIIVIDLDKNEIKDTYIIGSSGNKIKVNTVTNDNNFFYAATEEGLKRASLTTLNLADFRNWELLSGANGLPGGAVQSAMVVQGTVVALKNDTLYSLSGSTWSVLYEDGWTIHNSTISDGKILLSEVLNTTGRIAIVTATGTIENFIQDNHFTANPSQAVFFQNNYWIADSLNGLSKLTTTGFESYIPNSPYSVATGNMQVYNNRLWATAGAVTANWQPATNKNGVFRFTNNSWDNYNVNSFPQLDSFPDFITVAIDPANESAWVGSYGGGLVNIENNNSITAYKQNSPLQPAYFAAGSYRVSGLAFDADRNLWVANYGGNANLHVRKPDGNWQSFSVPFPLAEKAVAQIVIDDNNQKWIISPLGNGLLCFNHGQSIENTGDDQWKWYRAGQGNGNLPDNNVLCIAKDKSNFIWAGTTRGIGLIQCPGEVFTPQGCEAVLPIVQQDNFAGYLFRDEQVQAIAVDGADRKWVGTKNGVWLISADAEKTIYRFNESNSPLLSNDVRNIAIDGKTGEVFFTTAKGICSFRSTATEGSSSNTEVLVFPNPVPPGYTGSIAIRGIASNAIVKITELDGRLVYQTRAFGGQAIWNGKDYKGRTISTGVYLVLVSDDNRQENLATKIVFIKK